MRGGQDGFSLLETLIAVALLSIAVLGALAAFGGVAKLGATDPQRAAAERAMARMLTLESAAVKYAGSAALTVSATPWKTAMPFPNGTPIPVTISAQNGTVNTSPAITLMITYPHNGATATLSKSIPLTAKAPPPQARITAPGQYADPSSTPTP